MSTCRSMNPGTLDFAYSSTRSRSGPTRSSFWKIRWLRCGSIFTALGQDVSPRRHDEHVRDAAETARRIAKSPGECTEESRLPRESEDGRCDHQEDQLADHADDCA